MLENEFITLEESKNIRLSKNFTLYEFLRSDIALRNGIDNSMPRAYLPRIQYLVDNVLQPLRDVFGPIRITSGYRSRELAIKVGSSVNSNHCYGLAADIEPYSSDIKLITVLNYIYHNLPYKELIGEYFPNGWVHVASQKDNNLKVLKLKDDANDYTRIDIDYINDKYLV